jgi:hypothetical protein
MKLGKALGTLTALSLVAVVSAPVLACPEGGHKKARFEQADTNGDGALSQEEFVGGHVARIQERFQEADGDGDGVLAGAELKAMRPHRRMRGVGKMRGKRIMNRLDEDADGRLTLDEVVEGATARQQERFEKLDTDADGSLTQEEISAGFQKRHRRGRGRFSGKD